MAVNPIKTDKASPALGHYEQGYVANGMIFTSIQLPIKPDGSHMIDEPIEKQALQLYSNILEIVKGGGGSMNSIVRVTLYVSDIAFWEPANKVYAEFFGAHKPARGVVAVKELHKGYKIAMDAVAVING